MRLDKNAFEMLWTTFGLPVECFGQLLECLDIFKNT